MTVCKITCFIKKINRNSYKILNLNGESRSEIIETRFLNKIICVYKKIDILKIPTTFPVLLSRSNKN